MRNRQFKYLSTEKLQEMIEQTKKLNELNLFNTEDLKKTYNIGLVELENELNRRKRK